MSWMLMSLIAPFTWSLVNHGEKIILSRYFHGGGAGTLMAFICVVAIPIALLMRLIFPMEACNPYITSSLVLSGVLYGFSSLLYLKVLERHDTSYAVSFWQLTPVFTYGFGYALLGEHLELEKTVGGLAVISGAVILSFNFRSNRPLFDSYSISYMCLSSAALSLSYVIFKDAEGASSFWTSAFWNQVGMAVFGLLLLLFGTIRREFIHAFKANNTPVLALNGVIQILDLFALVAANFALRFAPAALVVLIEYSAQPVFVFVFGILLTLISPEIVSEDVSGGALLQRSIAIGIMITGLFFVV